MYETPSPPFSGWRVICAHKSGSSVHTDPVHLYTHFGFICTRISGSSVHTELSGDGVGWGGLIKFMFLCTHRHSNLIIFLAVLQTQALLLADQLPVGWGGVITFMFLFTHRHTQPDHLSCSPANTGTTLS